MSAEIHEQSGDQTSFDPARATSGLPGTHFNRILERGPALAVLDLDYSLAYPNGSHSALLVATAASLGFKDEEVVRQIFAAQRAQPYTLMIQKLYRMCGGDSAFQCSFSQFWEQMNLIARDAVSSTEFPARPALVPGAVELIEALQAHRIPFVIASGSPRAFVDFSLRMTGLAELIGNAPVYGADDLGYEKHQRAFWDTVLQDVARERVVAFEDRAHAAQWMISAGVGLVVLRPGKSSERMKALALPHFEKILLVDSWEELF